MLQHLKNWLQKAASVRIAKLPTVSAADLAAAENDEEYLSVFVEAYERQITLTTNPLVSLPDQASALLLFGRFTGEVSNGGFIQLIQNGHGPWLFDSPFVPDLARWGATQLAELATDAKGIYVAHKEYLERPRAIPEFSALYKEFRAFEPLEDRYYDIIDSQMAIVRAYVEQHLSQFAHVA